MRLTPETIEAQTFKERFKGYDMEEVDAFLDRVVQEVRRLIAERDEALHRAHSARDDTDGLLQRTLVTAQRTSEQIVAEAREEARRVVEEARVDAAAERARIAEDAADATRAIEELRRFRSGYREQLRQVVAEHLAVLERTGELPDVPHHIEDTARTLHESVLDAGNVDLTEEMHADARAGEA